MTSRTRTPTIKSLEASIRRRLSGHLRTAGFVGLPSGEFVPTIDKDLIRRRHLLQREDRIRDARSFVEEVLPDLLPCFASGRDVVPSKIAPRLQLVGSKTREARLFRLASLVWSIPVSEGYGRRMRFLVWDDSNGKLMGLIALGDPVFNLHVRDNLIGWTAKDRKERLVNVMDAFVLGALPPYNQLLGGKLVASLVRTKEVCSAFNSKYGQTTGIISARKKHARLVLVTTSSALGRSSVYNRLRLGGSPYFEQLGYTAGFGHFHVPDALFEDMREYLRRRKCAYSDGNRFGSGPNWKFRAIRSALELMGMERDILRHGVKREVFVCRVASNAYEILRGEAVRPKYHGVLSVKDVGRLAVERWIQPRAERRPDFALWSRDAIVDLVTSGSKAGCESTRDLLTAASV